MFLIPFLVACSVGRLYHPVPIASALRPHPLVDVLLGDYLRELAGTANKELFLQGRRNNFKFARN